MDSPKAYSWLHICSSVENPDFVAVANAYGLAGKKVSTTAEFAAAFETVNNSETGGVIELDISVEARFDAGGSISRHAWGIAIDINTKSGYPTRIVEIFNSWGFAWGGTWTSPDEMHFELRDLSASISKASS